MSEFCECADDGYCSRYRREMHGRMRELCAGVNVDLGAAAEFREQWTREAGVQSTMGPPRPLLLKTDQAVGDAVVMTAAIYSLHRAHPGRFLTAVESPWPEVFAHNPNVVPVKSVPGAESVEMHYPAIHQANERGIHFMQGWCEHLGAALGIDVPLLTNRPRLYFNKLAPLEDYWVVCSGGKRDFTSKVWGSREYQQVISSLDRIVFVQVGSAYDDHPALDGVVDIVGKTTLRRLFDLVRQSRGVLCGVSLLMHVAAALEKPAVVVAGGREPVQWNAYPRQQYLHTVGALPCCAGGGCWKSRVVPLGDGSPHDGSLCERPVNGVPECMGMIKAEEVTEKILRYNQFVENAT